MNTRIMRADEWNGLGTDLPVLLSYCSPENAAVVVVEDGSRVLASVAALQVTHFEGLNIIPEERGNAGVFRSLIRHAYALPLTRGERWAIGGAAEGDAKMDTLCHRLGGRSLPLKFFALPLGGS